MESVSPEATATSSGIDDTYLTTSFRTLNLSRTKSSPSPVDSSKQRTSRKSSIFSNYEVESEEPKHRDAWAENHHIVPGSEKR